MAWDYVEYRVSESFLSAIFNGDTSGLNTGEVRQIEKWETLVKETWGDGHFSYDNDGEDFKECDICGLFSKVEVIRYNFQNMPT